MTDERHDKIVHDLACIAHVSPHWGAATANAIEYIERLRAQIAGLEHSKSGTHEDTRRLRRFAEMALAVEGKDETFGSQLTADRELGFLREDFLGEHAKGADAYTAFCRAIDNLTDSAELPPKPNSAEEA